jgi:hypothetical protein
MNPLILTAWLACQSLDGATTAIALARPGMAEANPIMRMGHVPIRVSVNLGALLLYRKAHKANPGVRAIPYILAGSGCGVGAWNLAQLRKAR